MEKVFVSGGSGYIGGVSNGSTIAGNASMPNPDGGTMTGREGNGLVIISWWAFSFTNPRLNYSW